MTETEARSLLIGSGIDALDPWIAAHFWQPVLGGWLVVPALNGWRFQVELAPAGRLRITAFPPGGVPAVWFVPPEVR